MGDVLRVSIRSGLGEPARCGLRRDNNEAVPRRLLRRTHLVPFSFQWYERQLRACLSLKDAHGDMRTSLWCWVAGGWKKWRMRGLSVFILICSWWNLVLAQNNSCLRPRTSPGPGGMELKIWNYRDLGWISLFLAFKNVLKKKSNLIKLLYNLEKMNLTRLPF